MSDITIYHNPRCTKSRKSLALLEDAGLHPQIVLYLEHRPDATTLTALLKKLGIGARDLIRKGEAEYKEAQLDDPSLDEKTLIDAMVKYPKLIERPIVVKGNKAVIGRPPENILPLIT